MVRHLLMAAVLSSAASLALAPAASAQTYGAVTLSFGSGGYDRYYEDDYRGYPGYAQPRYDPYYQQRYYQERREAWIARQRYEQHERWERQQRAQRDYWRHEHDEHRGGQRDDDDD